MDKVQVDNLLWWGDVENYKGQRPTDVMDHDLKDLGVAYVRFTYHNSGEIIRFHRLVPQSVAHWLEEGVSPRYRFHRPWMTANAPMDIPTAEVLRLSPDQGSARSQLVRHLLSL